MEISRNRYIDSFDALNTATSPIVKTTIMESLLQQISENTEEDHREMKIILKNLLLHYNYDKDSELL